MASGRRYFILEEPLPASEIPDLLGRVVVDKLLPLHSYAPFPSPENEEPPHNPTDIILDLLPKPIVWTDRKDFFTHTSDWKIRAGLADFLGVENIRENKKGISLESEEFKCYSLSNTTRKFNTLMKNEQYAQDVGDLLKDSGRSHAYFIVGFLTTKGAMWTEFASKSHKTELDVTVPVLESIGSPLAGIGDPKIAPGFKTSLTHGRTMKIEEERIIAVAYDIVKTSYKFGMSTKKFVKTVLINAGRAQPNSGHMAFSYDDDDDEEEEEEEEEGDFVGSGDEDNETVPNKSKSGVSLGIEIREYPTLEELSKADESSGASFYLNAS
jgi:hypothetical protein